MLQEIMISKENNINSVSIGILPGNLVGVILFAHHYFPVVFFPSFYLLANFAETTNCGELKNGHTD